MAARESTPRRVLGYALELIDEYGVAGWALADLSARSGVSNGSIYHHFHSKDGVIGALVLEAMDSYQHTIYTVLDDHADNPAAAVRGVVAAHLGWIENHRAPALLLLNHRGRISEQPWSAEARARNQEFIARTGLWLDQQITAGAIPAVGIDAAHAIVYAPADEIGRLWLQSRLDKAPTSFAQVLGDAAWLGLSRCNERTKAP
ncbi:TetR/AcrR family transcriptional regulator [Nocardia gipuzkoensis]